MYYIILLKSFFIFTTNKIKINKLKKNQNSKFNKMCETKHGDNK